MKRIILTACLLIAALSFIGVSAAHALNARSGHEATLGKNETLNSSLYIAGDNVTIAGTVHGDVFCIGQTVNITGMVDGDVLCAAQNLQLSGKITGSVRAAAQVANVGSDVTGSMSIAGQNVTLQNNAKIGRDLQIAGSQVTLSGTVNRDVLGAAQDMTIGGTVKRDVDLSTVQLTVNGSATIGGALTYKSDQQGSIDHSAKIAGATTFSQVSTQDLQQSALLTYAESVLFSFAAMLLLGLALLGFVPRSIDAPAEALQRHPVAYTGIGVLTLFVVPVIAFLLFITVVGMPLAIVIMLVWLAVLTSSTVFGGYALGRAIVAKLQWPKGHQRLAAMVLGQIVLWLLALIPIVGVIVVFVVMVAGMGGVVGALRQHTRVTKITPAPRD